MSDRQQSKSGQTPVRAWRHAPARQGAAARAHKSIPFCPKPFGFLSVHADGTAWVCCHDWLDKPIGDLNNNTFAEVWNSKAAQEIRASILDGSFRYCNHETCPALVQGTLKQTDEIWNPYYRGLIDNEVIELDQGPRTVSLSYDNTCNLKCPSCRVEIIALKGAKYKQAERLQAKILQDGLADAQDILITGYGDAFASRLYRELLRTMTVDSFPNLSIHLMTNGLLFTPPMWNSLKKIQPAIVSVHISIDAATPETYAVNRGGSFPKLLQNLEFISHLVETRKLPWFEISFVVQANNFSEMKAFVEMGKRFNCGKVLFQKIIQWGTYTPEVFQEIAIHEPTHPAHEDFLAVLRDTVFDDPIVDLSNLENLRDSCYNSVQRQ